MNIKEIYNQYEDASPNPEYLIKSIAEQGYSLETALADLIDNSISAEADKIEILTDVSNKECLKMFIVDNGNGMSEEQLIKNLKFPSSSVEEKRVETDLGRFGLGLKTASFSQTRKFTVISRYKNQSYNARTWDVDYLKRTGKWRIIINTNTEIDQYIKEYKSCSENYQKQFENLEANTIIVWHGLYKYERFIDSENRANSLIDELNKNTIEYLGIVFHRFLQKPIDHLAIRINHYLVTPFDPFPIFERTDLRTLGVYEKLFKGDVFKVEGFVLPAAAIKESKQKRGWITPNKNLMDLEGLYIYRGDRIIHFGSWNGLVKRSSNLKLARLRVDVGNLNDDLLQLNVAKSKISIPYELKLGFLKMLSKLKDEAKKEYFNHGIRNHKASSSKKNTETIFTRHATSKGAKLVLNIAYPGIELFINSLKNDQNEGFKILLRSINTQINKMRNVVEESDFIGIEEKDELPMSSLIKYIEKLKEQKLTKSKMIQIALTDLGYTRNNLPEDIKKILENES
jgi:hypothetical protein|tara:strand:- start:967 stop:2505 length:1539 start_codon:yes stop_codon:yes gene_type:complete